MADGGADLPAAFEVALSMLGIRSLPARAVLLQVECTALGFAEGILCFVAREEDLARRDLARVHAIYQQT